MDRGRRYRGREGSAGPGPTRSSQRPRTASSPPNAPHSLKEEITEWPSAHHCSVAHVRQVATLTAAAGAHHLVLVPPMYRDEKTGEFTESPELTAEQWAGFGKAADRLGRLLLDEDGRPPRPPRRSDLIKGDSYRMRGRDLGRVPAADTGE